MKDTVNKPVRFQFGIRRLLILTTVAAVVSAWAAHHNAPVFLQAVLAAYLMIFTGWVIMRVPSIWDKHSALRERWRQVKQRRIELETTALQAKQAIDEARSAGRSEQISELTAAGASHGE